MYSATYAVEAVGREAFPAEGQEAAKSYTIGMIDGQQGVAWTLTFLVLKSISASVRCGQNWAVS